MTRRQLRLRIYLIMGFFAFVLIAGVIIYYCDTTEHKIHYQILKDMIPLAIAIPASYLGYSFQQRTSFLQALKEIWKNSVASINLAINYTYQKETTVKEYNEVIVGLSKIIDEFRAVYKNIDKKKHLIKIFPFESLKDIHRLIAVSGYGTMDNDACYKTRNEITEKWRVLKEIILSEFDRFEPTEYDTTYIKS